MNNCKGFEYNFINMSDDELKKHIKSCQACQKEYFLIKKTQNSIKELQPYFKKPIKMNFIKASSIAAIFFIAFMGASFYSNYQDTQLIASLSQDEYIQDGILPLDEYGLISIE